MSQNDKETRRRRYQGVLGAVEKAAADKPGISSHTLYQNRTQADVQLGKVKTAIRAACENGDLIRVHDRDGTLRYVPTDGETLRETVEWLADADDPNREDIGKVNRALQDAD